jgi:hypothetical protein
VPGHVFVVQGRVESLVKDAVVVTTDAALTFEPHWEAVLGAKDASGLRPEWWAEDSAPFGAARGRPGLWFLDVTHAEGSADLLMQDLDGVLEAIAASGLKASAGRELPLVAVPADAWSVHRLRRTLAPGRLRVPVAVDDPRTAGRRRVALR